MKSITFLVTLLLSSVCIACNNPLDPSDVKGKDLRLVLESLSKDEIRFILELNTNMIQVPKKFEEAITRREVFVSLSENKLIYINNCVEGFALSYQLSFLGEALYSILIDVAVEEVYDSVKEP